MSSKRYWLMKSEPSVYSIDDLKADKTTYWNGVRNYQARNFMRNDMKKGDLVLFYHSNADPSGIAGIAKICKEGYTDHTAKDDPRWIMVDLQHVKTFSNFISLAELRECKGLNSMLVLKRGMRLSVQPVDEKHFNLIKKLGK